VPARWCDPPARRCSVSSPSAKSFWLKKGKIKKEKKVGKMASPPISTSAQIPRCPVLFTSNNYHEWVPHMRLHMRGLQLWGFLSGELPCPPLPTPPVQPVIPTGTSEEDQKKLREAYEDDMASYASHFQAYQTWLDEDARAGAVLVASMDPCLAADVVRLDHASQMWAVRQHYEPLKGPKWLEGGE
jgi:hypothetical protein